MAISQYMNLTVWDQPTDTFDYAKLAENFYAIDKHDHGANGGAPIDGAHVAPGTVTNIQLGPDSVGTLELKNRSVTRIKIKQGIAPELTSNLAQPDPELPPVSDWGQEYDGFEIYYQDTSENSSMGSRVWHLRFKYEDATANNISTWQFVGGSPITSFADGVKTFTSNNSGTPYQADTWYDLSTVGGANTSGLPKITVPKGKYYVLGTARGGLYYKYGSAVMHLCTYTSDPGDFADNKNPKTIHGIRATSLSGPDIYNNSTVLEHTAGSLSVVNEVTVTDETSGNNQIKLYGRVHSGYGPPAVKNTYNSNFSICSLSVTPIYINAV